MLDILMLLSAKWEDPTSNAFDPAMIEKKNATGAKMLCHVSPISPIVECSKYADTAI